MEANSARKGFLKGKLVKSFCRAANPAASSTVQYMSSEVNPRPSASSTASVGFVINHDYVTPQPNQKVFFAAPEINGHDSYSKFENLYGVAADESVDLKAASYIFCVRERFRLE